MEAFKIKYPTNMTKLHNRRCNNLDIDQEIIRTNLLKTMPCQYDQYTTLIPLRNHGVPNDATENSHIYLK